MLSKLFGRHIGIDLGTANTLIYDVRANRIVLNEPSVVAVSNINGRKQVLAVGEEAKSMLGRTPANIIPIRPLKDGVIADFEAASMMIESFLRKVRYKFDLFKPQIVICVPSGATEVEKKAIQESAERKGSGKAFLIEETMAAAIGAGLPVNEATGSMVVDIGGGTTEVAVLSLGGVVFARSIRVGGDKMDSAIASYIKRHYNLLIGDGTAETIKKKIGSAYLSEEEMQSSKRTNLRGKSRVNKVFSNLFSEQEVNSDREEEALVEEDTQDITVLSVKGRDLSTGIPKEIQVKRAHIAESLQEPVEEIIAAVKNTLENTPPELAADIVERGIMLTGGGALLHNLDIAIHRATLLPVQVAENALFCVAIGTGKAAEQLRHIN